MDAKSDNRKKGSNCVKRFGVTINFGAMQEEPLSPVLIEEGKMTPRVSCPIGNRSNRRMKKRESVPRQIYRLKERKFA